MRGRLREKRPGYWELRLQAGRDPLTGQHGQASRTFRGEHALTQADRRRRSAWSSVKPDLDA